LTLRVGQQAHDGETADGGRGRPGNSNGCMSQRVAPLCTYARGQAQKDIKKGIKAQTRGKNAGIGEGKRERGGGWGKEKGRGKMRTVQKMGGRTRGRKEEMKHNNRPKRGKERTPGQEW